MSKISRQLTGSHADVSVLREHACLAWSLAYRGAGVSRSQEQAAKRLGIGTQTLKNYLGDLYRELGVSGHFASTDAAHQLGWAP